MSSLLNIYQQSFTEAEIRFKELANLTSEESFEERDQMIKELFFRTSPMGRLLYKFSIEDEDIINDLETYFPFIYQYIVTRYNKNISMKDKLFLISRGLITWPICCVCGKELSVGSTINYLKRKIRGRQYYNPHCSNFCTQQDQEVKNTICERNIAKFGVPYSFQAESVKNNIKKTLKEKYGEDIENAAQVEWVKEKIKQHFIDTYNVENPFQLDWVKEKITNTLIEKYNVEHPYQNKEIQKRGKKTNLERYGVEWATSSEIIKEKVRKTCFEKYGKNYYFQTDECKRRTKEFCLKNYGVEYISQSPIIKEKIKETNRKKYGVDFYSKTKEFKNKIHENKEKILEKIFITKRKNGTFNTSKLEDNCYILIKEKFSNVIRQHKSKNYPFMCDFYIPEIDTYIEIQGTWTHGHHPFDKNNTNDINTLILWKTKAKSSVYYNIAINVWTKTDPLKRKIAKENSLNWFEFWSLEELKEWLDKQ